MAKALVKRKRNGSLYQRRPAVEASIDELSLLSADEFFRRLPLPKSEPGQVNSECLIHFLRDSWDRKDNSRFDRIFKELLNRCRALSLACGFSEKETEIILQEFATFLADELCETTKYKLDFYERSFNSAFEKFRISKVSRKRKAPTTAEVPVGDAMSDGGLDTAGALHALFNQEERAKPPDKLLADKEKALLTLRVIDAIGSLPEDLKKPMTLHYLLDYPLHSSDSTIETVATKCGISEKSVHNRLNRAYKLLKTRVKEEL